MEMIENPLRRRVEILDPIGKLHVEDDARERRPKCAINRSCSPMYQPRSARSWA
jgi:hypothetical protein